MSKGSALRGLLVTGLVIASMVAEPHGAYAASAAVVGSTVVYTASPGEANAITVEGDPQGISFTDTGATIVAGPGCIQVSANRVFCSSGVDQLVTVDLGDMDDRFSRCAGLCFGPSVRFAITAGEGNDVVVIPSGQASTLDGGPGSDVLTGGDGGDAIEGGDGDDVLDSGGGRPVFPQDSLSGGGGNDVLRFRTRSGFISGGNGSDLADYSWATTAFTIRLGGFSGPNFDFQLQFISDDVENATGGSADDTIVGSAFGNVLTGGPGADSIDGGDGDDVILARDGAMDQIVCGAGSDSVTADPVDLIAPDCEFVDGNDTTPPTISCPANIITSTALGQATAVVSFAATAEDNTSTPTITYSHEPGSAFPVGSTTVTATATDAAGNSATCSFTITVNLSLLIDIKPGTLPNSVNLRARGTIPVAILAVGAFDPLVLVQPSLRFGPTGSETSPLRCSAEDVSRDGRIDLVCQFDTLATAFHAGDTTGTISGRTVAGDDASGSDSIRIVPPE